MWALTVANDDWPVKKVMSNLSDVEEWISNAPDPATFKNNDDFMQFTVELMNRTHYLLRVGVSLAPSEITSQRGYSKHRAIIVGHLVRLTKLYEGSLIHISRRELELAAIFFRLIYETTVRMKYLMQSKSKGKSIRSFILASYKPEKEVLADLDDKARNRPLINIEKRMRRKIRARLKRDGISVDELMNNKMWSVDGKGFRQILAELGGQSAYSYAFGSGSHAIHGDWHEIDLYHLEREGRYYLPKLSYDDPDPRLACPLTEVCLDTLLFYLKWSKCDPDNVMAPVVSKLLELSRAIDVAHENTLGA